MSNTALIMAATNYKNQISKPMLDRISTIIFVDVPDKQEIAMYFHKKVFRNITFDHVEEQQPSSSQADDEDRYVNVLNETYSNHVINNLVQKMPYAVTFRNLNHIFDLAKDKFLYRNFSNDDNKQLACLIIPKQKVAITLSIVQFNELNQKNHRYFEYNVIFQQFEKKEFNYLLDLNYVLTFPIKELTRVQKQWGLFNFISYRPEIIDFDSVQENIEFLSRTEYEEFLKSNDELKKIEEIKNYTDADFKYKK